MKYILSILFTCSTYFSYSQMSLTDFYRIYNMDFDQFETYAISKGYEFLEIKNDEHRNGHTYTKGSGLNTKFLTLCNRYFEEGIHIAYQTSNSKEYLNIKNEMKNAGYFLYSENTFLDEPYKIFRNNKYEIYLMTMSNSTYEITLSKFK